MIKLSKTQAAKEKNKSKGDKREKLKLLGERTFTLQPQKQCRYLNYSHCEPQKSWNQTSYI